MHFTDVTADAGILHTHSHDAIEELFAGDSIALDYSQMSGGAVAEDFDGDGWIDLYVLKGGDAPNLLYINQRDGTFADEAPLRGADVTGAHMGTAAADYDSDGDIDLFISSAIAPHLLLLNDGTGTFTPSPQTFSLPATRATSPNWGDLNNDGLLELSLGSWHSGRRPGSADNIQIYRNTGEGQLASFLSLPQSWDFNPRFSDLDGDRFQDLLVIADFGNTRWFRNTGDGLFLPSGESKVEHGMGSAVGDLDNDGDLDLFITSIIDYDPNREIFITTGNRLHLNDGAGDFTEISASAGVREGAWGWGAEMADFDNDGDLDIYHVNGWTRDLPAGNFAEFNLTPARLFENRGENSFEEIAAASGDAAENGQGRCVIAFDYDNDGDQDLFIANNSVPVADGSTINHAPGPPVLLRNDSANNHHFLEVRLAGNGAPHHSQGIGARVYLATGEVEQMRELHASSGFNGHGPRRLAHFGLGDNAVADRIRARWTNGDETEWRAVAADQSVTLSSPRASVSARALAPGEAFTASFPALDLPAGATASWTIEGVDYPNPATASLTAPGTYALRVTIATGDEPADFLWAETLTVRVKATESDDRSIARLWNEQNLAAIRLDFPDPTDHARNLFASSVAMWDAWAAYDATAQGVLHHEAAAAGDLEAARREAISYAAYRILSDRYGDAVNGSTTLASLRNLMADLGFDPEDRSTAGDTPAALGNRVAATALAYTASDGWDDTDGFQGGTYAARNEPLAVKESGTTMGEPNYWQPLLFEEAFTQNQQTTDLIQSFLGPHWGAVRPFALASLDPGQDLHLDPGPPPVLGGASDEAFKAGNVAVIGYSSLLDPNQGQTIDISPGAIGNNTLGFNDGTGYPLNPATGEPYPPNVVNHADFARILAEFWADGPESETPPGHWNVLANELHEHPDFERRFGGEGDPMDLLEWDVKLYLALNGALHDAAIAAWGCKRVYDFVRPISSIRYLGERGQSSDPDGPSYDPLGLPLVPDLIELITEASSASGQRHAHLAGAVGQLAIRAWSAGEDESLGRVDWILAADWLPYQRDTFVTPAFPGYVSGHSTFSRAAAEVLHRITGDAYFPGGLGSFTARENEFLEFEPGPTTDVVLQWATYYDAADQAGLSRLYGGIHVPVDDGPGRIIGATCGITAWALASRYFDGSITSDPIVTELLATGGGELQLEWNATRGAFYKVQSTQTLNGGNFIDAAEWTQATETTEALILPVPSPETPGVFYRIIRSETNE